MIINTKPPLFLYSLPLVVQICFVDVQRLHPIALEEQRELELVRGNRLEVQGAILICRPIHRAAVRKDQGRVLARSDVLGSLEHHVLEQVSEPRAARLLVGGPHVVGDRDRDGRRGVIL